MFGCAFCDAAYEQESPENEHNEDEDKDDENDEVNEVDNVDDHIVNPREFQIKYDPSHSITDEDD